MYSWKVKENSYNKTTFGTVQKWSLRPLLNSPKGGLFLEDTECKNKPHRKNDWHFFKYAFKGESVLILGGLVSGILLYCALP